MTTRNPLIPTGTGLPTFSDSGFDPRFQENGTNQVRHAVANLVQGGALGRITASGLNTAREILTIPSGRGTLADILLGHKTSLIGSQVINGQKLPSQVPDILGRQLGP